MHEPVDVDVAAGVLDHPGVSRRDGRARSLLAGLVAEPTGEVVVAQALEGLADARGRATGEVEVDRDHEVERAAELLREAHALKEVLGLATVDEPGLAWHEGILEFVSVVCPHTTNVGCRRVIVP